MDEKIRGKADSTKLRHGQHYSLADELTPNEEHMFGLNARAMWTGDKRRPLKGEWYLSGSVIEAYRAPSHLSEQHQIARLVRY